MADPQLGPKRAYLLGGWVRTATVAGTSYLVGVERGKPVRIAFKPKGQNLGYTWWGFVRTPEGKRIWEGEVGKSLGARGLLLAAGIALPHQCKPGRNECEFCRRRRVSAGSA